MACHNIFHTRISVDFDHIGFHVNKIYFQMQFWGLCRQKGFQTIKKQAQSMWISVFVLNVFGFSRLY